MESNAPYEYGLLFTKDCEEDIITFYNRVIIPEMKERFGIDLNPELTEDCKMYFDTFYNLTGSDKETPISGSLLDKAPALSISQTNRVGLWLAQD